MNVIGCSWMSRAALAPFRRPQFAQRRTGGPLCWSLGKEISQLFDRVQADDKSWVVQMSSLHQRRIAVLTSLAAQLRELERLRERVRKAELAKRAAGRSRPMAYGNARKPVPARPGSAVAV
jgi:hypothetical protein